MKATRKKTRIGDLLIGKKFISKEQLETALEEQKKSGRKLGRILVDNGYVEENDMLEVLSRQLKIPFIDLQHYKFNIDTIKLISEIQARRFRAIALSDDPGGILVGMADPTDILAYDEISRILNRPVNTAVVRESDLMKTIDRVYRKTDQISGFAEQLSDELAESDIDLEDLVSRADVTDAPVVRLLQSLFEDAIQIKASDIHIEPDEQVLRIRQRVDGVLQEHIMEETRIASALVLRLKLMAGLDISEKRMPQDGRFSIKVKEHNIDVRLSTMPVAYGESVVMRLLDQTGGTLDMNILGMPDALLKRFDMLIHRPHGMILVTGPTGSGKTTTLYAALKTLNKPENKIITVEDPVEYRLPRINQVQVNSEIGLTFARVLRSALRQDPDIILIGEMRDEETSEIGLRAAMTGHMVLSTLHTNDAISTVNRLMDMGIKNYLLASALHGILAQRLVRRICPSCSQPAELQLNEKGWLKEFINEGAMNTSFKKGAGCDHCNHTGYQGRIGVYELLEFDEDLTAAVAMGDVSTFNGKAKIARDYIPLNLVALQYAMEGITTMEEVLRVTADMDIFMDEGLETISGGAAV